MPRKQICKFVSLIFLMFPLMLSVFNGSVVFAESSKNDAGTNDKPGEVRIISTSEEGIILEFEPASPEFSYEAQKETACQTVTIPGLSQETKEGQVPLPVKGVMIGIPDDAQPVFKVQYAESSILQGSYQLCPWQQPVMQRDANGMPMQVGTVDVEINRASTFLPGSPAELYTDGYLRNQRFLAVQFNPLRYDATTGDLRFYSKIQVEIWFNSTGERADPKAPFVQDRYFEENYKNMLLNYDQAKQWRTQSDKYIQSEDTNRDVPVLYKIFVDLDGIYQMDYAYLEAAGIPVNTIDPRTFRIINMDKEIAIYVEGEDDGVFESGEYLLFYGQKNDTKYTDTNVYWLSWGGVAGLRMETIDGTPSGSASIPVEFKTDLLLENDVEYFSDLASGLDNDHWYWSYVFEVGIPAEIPFTIENISTNEHVINLSGLLNRYDGSTNPVVQVFLNDNLTPIFNGPISTDLVEAFSAELNQSDLLEGTNIIKIASVNVNDIVLINRFSLEYFDNYMAENDALYFEGDTAGTWEFKVDGFSSDLIDVFDLTDPVIPVNIINPSISSSPNGFALSAELTIAEEHRYLASVLSNRLLPSNISIDTSSNWKSNTQGADYIIISHNDFLDEMQPLVTYRETQDYRVALVDVEDVYDEFNGGVFAPEAIQSFLSYAYGNWIEPAPTFVLLVGDGHYDFKDIYGDQETIYIPPFLADVDPWIGEAPTDNGFVMVSGEDILPDMFIGRFPVSDATQAQVMVNKVLYYEQNPPVGDWNSNLTFYADNTDSGGDYDLESDLAIGIIPPIYTSHKIYYGSDYMDATVARNTFISDLNEGRIIAHYAGHAALQKWATEGLFRVSDISSLTNADKQPFMLTMSCLEGYFAWPAFPSIAETIVRKSGGGAIASFSPTGFGLSQGHRQLDASIMNNLFNRHYNQLGYLTTQAKYDIFVNAPSHSYLIHTYMLFGDPALRLQTIPVPLEAPTLDASTINWWQINLSWDDNSTSETAFIIERSLDGVSGWTEIARVGADVSEYLDSGLDPETTYYYRVRAYREGDLVFSEYSNDANATTWPLFKYYLPLVIR